LHLLDEEFSNFQVFKSLVENLAMEGSIPPRILMATGPSYGHPRL
jgi:hypothetical protein